MKKTELLDKALALTEEQSAAVQELTAALKKCRDLDVAIIATGCCMYAVNDKHIYDVEPSYDEWSVYEVNLKKQIKLPFIQRYNLENHDAQHCTINFDSDAAWPVWEANNRAV